MFDSGVAAQSKRAIQLRCGARVSVLGRNVILGNREDSRNMYIPEETGVPIGQDRTPKTAEEGTQLSMVLDKSAMVVLCQDMTNKGRRKESKTVKIMKLQFTKSPSTLVYGGPIRTRTMVLRRIDR